jgi:hypothetical protein
MKKVACRYAVVQFTPYTETGEFVNVGVVLMCPQTGFFDYDIQTRKSKRVTDFFDELPRSVYLRAAQALRSELKRLTDVLEVAEDSQRAGLLTALFDSLLRPRETIVRFSAPRVALTNDPAQELRRQFDYYVDRAFATPEYVEQTLERQIRAWLGALDLAPPFRPAKVGNDDVYARFPLVQQRGEVVSKVIKPFNLNQGEPMGIFDHGDAWLQKVRRLRQRRLLPHDVLFAVQRPPASDVKRYAACAEICTELSEQDVLVVDAEAQERIALFAQA